MRIVTMKDLIPSEDPRLRQISNDVELPLSQENLELLQGIASFVMQSQTKETDENGDKYTPAVGLSAVQIGINKKMFIIATADDEGDLFVYAVVNPTIESGTRKMIALKDGESCLSLPGREPEKVFRHEKIRWSGYLVNLEDGTYEYKNKSKMEGYLGIVFQHEYDHLQGVLYIDKSEKIPQNSRGFSDPYDPDNDTTPESLRNHLSPKDTSKGHPR
jgi:peptide deformylase